MRLEISQEPLYTEIYTKNTATPGWAQNADTHTLREPAHANALGRWNLQDKCRAPEWAQNADTHFVRACAVEMHFNIAQVPLYTEIYRKNAEPQLEKPDQAPALQLP